MSIRHLRPSLIAALVAGLALSDRAVAGPDWTELVNQDAGSFVTTAQIPLGVTGATLNTITGTLGGGNFVPDFEDLYWIRIINPAIFSVTITTANFNPQLFLFHVTQPLGGFGALANDDQSGTNNLPRLTNVSSDGTGVVIDLAGDYVLAVTGFNDDPLSSTGAIFNQQTSTEVSGADGPGGLNHLSAWTGNGGSGDYHMQFTGVGFPNPNVPAPAGAAALALGAAAMGRRRR